MRQRLFSILFTRRPRGADFFVRTLQGSLTSFLCLMLISILVADKTVAREYTAQQQTYLDARAALKKHQSQTYRRLRAKLDDYPLAVYLDFKADIKRILRLSGPQAAVAIEQFSQTPLYNTARYRYLKHAGGKGRWSDFLAISPDPPKNTILQCYFYRALLAKGKKQHAFKGAERLWLSGHSRPEECDPLFSAWTKTGYLTQELLWSRMLLSFDARQYGLLSYLAGKITHHKTQARQLLSVYRDPNALRHINKFSGASTLNNNIVASGLKKLARKDLKQAIALYVRYQKADRFNDFQGRQLSRFLIRRAIINKETAFKPFIDTMLPLLESDDLLELRLRWAISENDFHSVNQFLPLLSAQKRAKPRWQYWLSRINAQGSPSSTKTLQDLSLKRSFYGFSAANEISVPYSLQHKLSTSVPRLKARLTDDIGLARVSELLALDNTIDARAEWVLMLKRHSKVMQKEYAVLALQRNWHDLQVQASIHGQLWNDMTLRFPYAANTEFMAASKRYKVNIDELRAIARRESAFYPYATSGVGARGLMQLMPATAKETAKKTGVTYKDRRSLYDNSINVQLGSAYYARLLKQFKNNRGLATTAYNAGPHRVKRWLKQTNGTLDVMAFIESIPFTETREYVQAVLSYRVIYQIKQNKRPQLFSPQEQRYKY